MEDTYLPHLRPAIDPELYEIGKASLLKDHDLIQLQLAKAVRELASQLKK